VPGILTRRRFSESHFVGHCRANLDRQETIGLKIAHGIIEVMLKLLLKVNLSRIWSNMLQNVLAITGGPEYGASQFYGTAKWRTGKAL